MRSSPSSLQSSMTMDSLCKMIDERRPLDSVLSAAEKLTTSSDSLGRIELFIKSQEQLRGGKYLESLETIAQAREQFGDHLTLTINAAWNQYHLERYDIWRTEHQKLASDYEAQASLVGVDTSARVLVALGHFAEENGRPSVALEKWNSVLSLENLRPSLEYRAKANILRVSSYFYQASPRMSALECELMTIPINYPTPHISEDIQHALMVCDFRRSTGMASSLSTLSQITNHRALSTYDLTLFNFDFFEEAFLLKLPLVSDIYSQISVLPQDEMKSYDLLLLQVYQQFYLGSSHGNLENDLIQARRRMPLARTLGLWLICLSAQGAFSSQFMNEVTAQFDVLVQALDPKDRELWQARSEIKVTKAASDKAAFNGSLVSKLLDILQSSPSSRLDLNVVFQSLWPGELHAANHLERLKNLVYRINKAEERFRIMFKKEHLHLTTV